MIMEVQMPFLSNRPNTKAGSQIGRSVQRLESRDKVTGRAEYTHLMQLPGMLHAKLFRSTVAHGRIRSLNLNQARQAAGVLHVVTINDIKKRIPNPYYGPAFHDQPILADGKVRFIGEPIAAVLAHDPHAAEEAVELITAEYEELPAIYNEIDAFNSKIFVHEQLKPAGTFADLKHLQGVRGTNIALDYRLRRGDFEKAYAAAEHKFEYEFKTQKVLHLPFEPFASIADFRHDHVIIHTASQSPSFVRIEIARLLGWPENKVRVKVPHLGGGYGSKLYVKLEPLAVALSMIARQPVKIAATMEEMFYQITKHPCTFRIKSGVDENGRIVARKCEVFWNTGAYADIGPRVAQKAGLTASGPYNIDNVWIDSYALYTNLTPSGALRGFGLPQIAWAYESHMDMMARALNIDAGEFRRKNLLREGDVHATGQLVVDAPLDQVLNTILERIDWKVPLKRDDGNIRRGRGFGIAIKAVTSPTTSVAIVNVAGDGSVILYCGTVDMGQGSDTGLAQIVGECLDVPAETVKVIHPDTDVTPYDMGTLGSRSLFHMGHAIQRAAEDVRNKIAALRREVGEPEGSNAPLAALLQKRYGMQAGNIIGAGAYKPEYEAPSPETGQSSNVTPFWLISGAGAEVEVDIETGQLKILKLINVVDAGKAVNPRIVETQISGGSIMQLGFTLFEQIQLDSGQITNASLADYKIPGFRDLPIKMENLYLQHDQSNGPFGAKGVGESSMFCVSPAIANAVEDAVGVRVTSLPLDPETLYRAIRKKTGCPLDDD